MPNQKTIKKSDMFINKFLSISVDESLTILKTDRYLGLTSLEVKKRQLDYGFNEILEKKKNTFLLFLKKFWGLTAWMLEITIILTWILQKYLDLYIITALLIFNAILGFVQEERASNAIESLKQKLHIKSRVLRDKTWTAVPARELVPGDILRLRSGDFVPADLKILDDELEVDQSALTGESLPVQKKSNDILYSGSIVRKGEADAVVLTIGAQTYFGRTTELIEYAKPKLHIEKVISSVVTWLLFLVGVLLIIALTISVIQHNNVIELLPLVLVLLVSSIPVALPAMFTITMAIGALELSRKGVLITRLNAVEDAATMDTLCVDKTGTLTMNKIAISSIITSRPDYTKEEVLLDGALASLEENQDPIDMAFITAQRESKTPIDQYIQKKFIPFDATTRRTEAIIENIKEQKQFTVVKGAFSTLTKLCNTNSEIITYLSNQVTELSKKGYRILAIASDKNNSSLQLVGIVALYDKPRPDSSALIADLKNLGVKTKMLTGDALPVAEEIASEVGLGTKIVKISDIANTLQTDPIESVTIVEQSDGFAEIYPEGKYLIVKSLQANHHIVGMTGDGVNDSPALRQAEVGIAVSNATDVAKSAGSVVLTNEGLKDIVSLVKVGRMIYQRIVTWVLNKVLKTFQIVVFVVFAFIFTGIYVVSAFEIILLIFLVDFVTLSLATDNVRWSKDPDTWDITGIIKAALVLGTFIVFESLGLLYFGLQYLGLASNVSMLYTFTFDLLIFSGLLTIFVVRERENFWHSKPSGLLLIVIITDSILSSIISIIGIPGLAPIPTSYVLFVLIYSIIFNLIINDIIKVTLIKKFVQW